MIYKWIKMDKMDKWTKWTAFFCSFSCTIQKKAVPLHAENAKLAYVCQHVRKLRYKKDMNDRE